MIDQPQRANRWQQSGRQHHSNAREPIRDDAPLGERPGKTVTHEDGEANRAWTDKVFRSFTRADA